MSEQHPGTATSTAEQALLAARASKSVRLEIQMLILVSQTFSAKVAKRDATQNPDGANELKHFQGELQALRPAREAVTLARKLKGKHGHFCELPWALYALAEAHL